MMGLLPKKFNSSFRTLDEANKRVQYVFYAENEWELGLDEMHVDSDKIDASKGTRRMCVRPDDSERWTVSVMPSNAFDFLSAESHQDDRPIDFIFGGGYNAFDGVDEVKPRSKFSKSIRDPIHKRRDAEKKLKYTIWTCDHHPYSGGGPDKIFNSSYDTLEEANERVEFVFYYKNPWGLGTEELPYPEENFVDKKKGTRFMECSPPDSSTWTVSVVPSYAFDFLNE